MTRLRSTTIAFIVGCVLAWLSVPVYGILAAQTWPAFVVAISKSSKLGALYLWGTVEFVPVFLTPCAAGYVCFRVVGASTAALLASVLPYLLLDWVFGSLEMLFTWQSPPIYGLFVMGQLAFPLGLLVAWQLVRRGPRHPASRGDPPPAFAA